MTIRAALLFALAVGFGTLVLAPVASHPTQAASKKKVVKAGRGEKVCRIKMKYSGEIKTFVCKKAEPCCAWHEINYVKCGSTITGCL
jgi:hypothetical protein